MVAESSYCYVFVDRNVRDFMRKKLRTLDNPVVRPSRFDTGQTAKIGGTWVRHLQSFMFTFTVAVEYFSCEPILHSQSLLLHMIALALLIP